MPPIPYRVLLTGGVKYLPVRFFAAAAPAPFLPHGLLHRRSNSDYLILLNIYHRFRSFSDHPAMAAANEFSQPGDETVVVKRSASLKSKLEEVGIHCGDCEVGRPLRMLCPKCKGGSSAQRSLSLFISSDGPLASWRCYSSECGWGGNTQVSGEVKSGYVKMKKTSYAETKQALQVNGYRQITESDLQLEPLCGEDTKCRYLWNCKEYLEKDARHILV